MTQGVEVTTEHDTDLFNSDYVSCLEIANRSLEALGGDASLSAGVPYNVRQNLVLALLLAGLEGAFSDSRRRQDYVVYHRDWLIRHSVLSNGKGLDKVYKIIDLLESQVGQIDKLSIDGLKSSVGGPISYDLCVEWVNGLCSLHAHLSQFENDRRYMLDPFSCNSIFPVFLRLLHSVARRFELEVLDEAILYHLYLRASGANNLRDTFCLAPHFKNVPEFVIDGVETAPYSLEENYVWSDLVVLGSSAGRDWFEGVYTRSRTRVGDDLKMALQLLRRGELDESRMLLDRVEACRVEICNYDEATFYVLGRFYYGEISYYHYCLGDFTEAYRKLDEAADSIRRAIETQRFLLPIAPLVVDIPLQKARIARRMRDWPAMEKYLKTMYEMEMAQKPLCVLGDGTVVDYLLLADRVKDLPAGEEKKGRILQELEVKSRLRDYVRLTTKLYLIPGLLGDQE